MDRLKKMCVTKYPQDKTLMVQPDEAFTPRELLERMARNQKLPSLRCNYDPASSFDDYGNEDVSVLDNMRDEPAPPLDMTDIDFARHVVKDFDKEIEKARNTKLEKKEPPKEKEEKSPE